MDRNGKSGFSFGRLVKGTQKAVIGLGCIAAIGVGIWLLMGEKVAAGSAAMSFGIVLFLLSNIELFESIKAPGVEAKLRDIDHKVDAVAQLTERVAGTSGVTAQITFELLSRVGRWSGPLPRAKALALVERASDELRALGVKEKELNQVRSPWHESVVTELLIPAMRALDAGLGKWQQLRQADVMALGPTTPDNPQHLRLQAEMEMYDRWRSLFSKDEMEAADRVDGCRRVLAETASHTLRGDFHGRAEAEESMRHAVHYLEHKGFLDVQYWLKHDPMRPDDAMNTRLA